MSFALPLMDMEAAAKCLSSGGILCFPTETFYAIGCLANNAQAVDAIFALKGRPFDKPLPLAAATLEQLASFVRLDTIPRAVRQFWPGPLTLVVKAKQPNRLARHVQNNLAEIAVRVSRHEVVQSLALKCNSLLTVSSANLTNCAPSKSLRTLDPAFLRAFLALANIGVIADHCGSTFNQPSTILRCQGCKTDENVLEVVREGAISLVQLAKCGVQYKLV